MVFIENGSVRKRKRDDENGVIIGNQDVIQVDGECYFDPFWMREKKCSDNPSSIWGDGFVN